jgi:hypothetical protein
MDGLAFLSHRHEGINNILVVTLQERPDGLVILLASNSTPLELTICGLWDIATIFSQYVVEGRAYLLPLKQSLANN